MKKHIFIPSFLFILMVLVTNCKTPRGSSKNISHAATSMPTASFVASSGFYGLAMNKNRLSTYPIPDSTNRRLFSALKKEYAAEGLVPEMDPYITPLTFTQAMLDSLKGIYFEQAQKFVATFKNPTKSQEEWLSTIINQIDTPGITTVEAFAALHPVNLIPCFELSNKALDFYEQDSATRNIMDYMNLDSTAYIVMADSSQKPRTMIAMRKGSSKGVPHSCTDYSDKMQGFSFSKQFLFSIPRYNIAFINNNKLYGLEKEKGLVMHANVTSDGGNVTNEKKIIYIHEVRLYDVQDAYNRRTNQLYQILKGNLESYKFKKIQEIKEGEK